MILSDFFKSRNKSSKNQPNHLKTVQVCFYRNAVGEEQRVSTKKDTARHLRFSKRILFE